MTGSVSRQVLERATLLDHDIRNAIADVVGALELADLDPLDDRSRALLQQAQRAAEQLARLSQEALVLATGDNHLSAPTTVLDLHEFVGTLKARWRTQSADGARRLEIEMAKDLPTTIGADPHNLERILNNLIGNAIKYGNGLPVTVSVHLGPQECLCFEVLDRGSGFTADAKARLFEFSARDDGNQHPGSGHGLHIANSLLKEIGGHLTINDRDGGGAKVTANLPRMAWAPGISDRLKNSGLPDLTGKTVLIAEDNETLQLLMHHMLESFGADIRIASDGLQALKYVNDQPFDLALIDIEMPRMSGLDLIRHIRNDVSANSNLPILAVTAFVINENRQQIYEAGADGITAKPILSIEALAEGITSILKKPVQSSNPVELPTPQGVCPTHIDRLLAFCDTVQGHELLVRLHGDLQDCLATLHRACDEEDFSLMRSGSHVLIALSGAVGDTAVQSISEKLNSAALAKDQERANLYCQPAIEGTRNLVQQLQQEIVIRTGRLP